jgi:hypothetical protein
MAVYGNMISLSLAISIPWIFHQKRYIYWSFILGILLSITSGVRRQILVFVVSYVLSYMLSIQWSFLSIIKKIGPIAIVIIASILIYPLIDNYINDISPEFHYRLFDKSQQLMEGDLSESDRLRADYFNQFINNFDSYLLPRGFVSKRTMVDEGTGIFIDSPYYELFYTFGIFVCTFMMVYLAKCILFHLKNYYVYKITESGVCIVSSIIIITLCLIEGSFLNYAFTTPFTGFVLGRISSTKNLVS